MKFRKKSRDNRGLTLVELIVTVAVSAIVVGAIWSFVLISSRSYESSKTEAELQQEVQQTMNHVQNLLIDTNKAVAYFYQEEDASFTQISSDYDTPKDATKRLEVYNDDTVGHLVWDKENQEIEYKEGLKADLADQTKWESAVLAKGVESFAIDASQVEKKNVLKVKMSFVRNNKTYTATRNIALRNSIINTGNTDDIYTETAGVEKPLIVVSGVDGDILYPRDSHIFTATITNAADTTLLWTIQGQKSDDTNMNITTGELVIGATETADEITVIATLESDRTVNGIYKFAVGDPTAPTVELKDERPEEEKGLHIPAPIDTEELVINALCGEEYRIPILADVKPADYSHKWSFIPVNEGDKINAKIEVERDMTGERQEYLVVDENQATDFWLRVDVVSNEVDNGYDLCYVNVIPPEPEIYVDYGSGIAKNEDLTLYGGTEVSIYAVWTGTVATDENPFGYSRNIFDKHYLEWTITTYNGTQTVSVKTDRQAAEDYVKAFTQMPYYGADKVTITAASEKYMNIAFPTITINVDEPVLSMKGYEVEYAEETNDSGNTLTVENKTELVKDKEVALYQDLQFVPEYYGGRMDNLGWTVTFKDRTTGTVVGPIDVDKSLVNSDAIFACNTVKTLFNNKRMFGQEVTVTVYEKNAPNVKASVTFTVKNAKACDEAVTGTNANLKTYDYLQPSADFNKKKDYKGNEVAGKYIANYGFVIPVDYEGEFKVSDYQVVYTDGTIGTNADIEYLIEAKANNDSNIVLFQPKVFKDESNSKNIQSIIYDIDDMHTREHICYIKLNMTLSNYNVPIKEKSGWGTNTVGYVAYYSPILRSSLEKKNSPYTREMNFINHYGYNQMSKTSPDDIVDLYPSLQPVSITCKYVYDNGIIFGWGAGWELSIYETGKTDPIYNAEYE